MIFAKNEFSWVHLYVKFQVTKQVPNGLVRIKETSLNLKFNPYTVVATVMLGVSQPSPPKKNLILRSGRSSGSNGHSEQLHHSSLWQDMVWVARTEEVFAFPCCFFFRVVAPLYLEELDCFSPCDTILLIQDFDRVLGLRQVSHERCHFRQYDVHRCLQTLLQL
jgi:hypothetical protein